MIEKKFRVWDEENKKMYTIAYPTWNGSIETRDGDYTHPTFFLSQNGPKMRGILLQYTGLKDKKGKEIYEGDLVKCFIKETKDNPDFEFCERKRLWFIKDIKEATWLGYYQEQKGDEFEVVGNIYENPKLLTNK